MKKGKKMNILVTTDDGPEALGLKLLVEAVKEKFPEARVVTMTTDRPMVGQGMSILPVALEDIELASSDSNQDFYIYVCKPTDLIYLACTYPERYLSTGVFDLLFAGINHGANVGADIVHSGTVGMCLFASTYFGLASVAFSQDCVEVVPKGTKKEQKEFMWSGDNVRAWIAANKVKPGECFNVNFPVEKPKGWRFVQPANMSRFRGTEKEIESLKSGVDLKEVRDGYATVTELRLTTTMPLLY